MLDSASFLFSSARSAARIVQGCGTDKEAVIAGLVSLGFLSVNFPSDPSACASSDSSSDSSLHRRRQGSCKENSSSTTWRSESWGVTVVVDTP
jgi:hypothetical protein